MGYCISTRNFYELKAEKRRRVSMSREHVGEVAKITQPLTSHIPIPYGCLTLVALTLGTLTTVVVSSLAIGIAILR